MAYDPVKAHEYYMKHRKLKGRKKTWTDEKKAAWASTKSQLAAEHNAISSGITAHERARKEQATTRANFMIKQIRNRLKYATPSQKEAFRKKLEKLIDNVRSELEAKRAKFTAQGQAGRAAERAAYKARKDQAYREIKGS